jgi:regulator of protease activity HflC (stomatin/prohibitin superfamily)
MNKLKLAVVGIGVLVASVIFMMAVDFATIKGHQLGVLETWNDGVDKTVYQPKTHPLVPGFSKKMYTYDMNVQEFSLAGYKIQAADNQDVTTTSILRWRRDPVKLIEHHIKCRDNPEQRVIQPTVLRVIKDKVTMKTAIEGYSGAGLVQLQKDIEDALLADQDLKAYGIIVEMFAIKDTDLNPTFIEQIEGRQVAIQRQLRAKEEQKAADADALVAKSKAQADYNKVLVEAQRDKEKAVLAAEAQNEQKILEAKAANESAILGAKAEQQKLILESEGKKQAAIAEAEGILALGKSKAEAQKLQLQAYAVQGADAYVKVEVAKSAAEAFKNIKGYLPADMKVNLLTDNFATAVDTLTGNTVVPIKK